MNLIDATYIHEAGGKEILEQLIEKIDKNKFMFLLDDRLILRKEYEKKINFKTIKKGEFNRLKFYKKNAKKYTKVVCLANVPPPFKFDSEVYIYFHNDLLLSTKNTSISLRNKLVLWMKRIYISFKNKNQYVWFVQTDLMKRKLNKHLIKNKNNIEVLPIFRNQNIIIQSKKETNSFLCVSNHNSHKNINNLLQAFRKFSLNNTSPIKLNLTIDESFFRKKFSTIIPSNGSVEVINHGQVDKFKVNELYQKSEYYIYPSLKESLGITLIEAAEYNCMIICSDLEYSYQVIKPSLIFDPYLIDSIYSSILKTQEIKPLNPSKLIIKNKIDKFIKYIS